MKVLHSIFSLILVIQAAFFGLMLLLIGYARDEGWLWMYTLAEQQGGLVQGCAGAALLICAGLWMLTGLSRRRCNKVTYEMNGGTVSIRMDAIRDFLTRVGQDIPQVSSVRPVVRQNNGVVSVVMEIRIRAGSSVPEITRALQERTRHSLSGDLGLSRSEPVQVVVTGITGDPSTPPVRKPPVFGVEPDPDYSERSGLRL
jgi:uncharacterized alkaline shock family protein YloU